MSNIPDGPSTNLEHAAPQIFRYTKPDFAQDRRKAVRKLGRTDTAYQAMQIIRSGGEETLHRHTNVDGFWTVIRGRVRFYTTDDVVIADLGPLEGIVIPRNFPYWFESTGDEDLEILQFESSGEVMTKEALAAGRINLAPREPSTTDHADIYETVKI